LVRGRIFFIKQGEHNDLKWYIHIFYKNTNSFTFSWIGICILFGIFVFVMIDKTSLSLRLWMLYFFFSMYIKFYIFFNHGNNNLPRVYLTVRKPDIPITCDLTGVEMSRVPLCHNGPIWTSLPPPVLNLWPPRR